MAIAPITFTVPSADNGAYPTVLADTTRNLYYALRTSVDGRWHFRGLVPSDYGSSPNIVVTYIANATSGVTRINVELAAVADNEDMDSSLTALTAQEDTVPGTAYLLETLTFDASAVTFAAGDTIIGAVFHDGDAANDTLVPDTLLANIYLSYTVA